MRHCCQFYPDDVYYLQENDLYSSRKFSIGFCPICGKPVSELVERKFNGEYKKTSFSGIKAHSMALKYHPEIVYSLRECNYLRCNSKPFGWKYGLNKSAKSGKKEVIKQYACDFYGNRELIKEF